MLQLIAFALVTTPISGYAQYALDEVCNNLAEIESWSGPEVKEFAQSSDEYIAALLSAVGGEDLDATEVFPDDWSEHAFRVQVASCYISGKGTERDIDKAMALLEEPAAAGHPSATHILASLRLFNTDDASLQKQGFETLEQEYESGSAFSAGKLGWAYQKGLGVEPDRVKALELYEYAAQRGMTYWQYLLAHAYEKGYLGLEPDPARAADWVAYKPKIHVALYECWVASYYADGTFPANDELQAAYQKVCDETDLGEWWAQLQSDAWSEVE